MCTECIPILEQCRQLHMVTDYFNIVNNNEANLSKFVKTMDTTKSHTARNTATRCLPLKNIESIIAGKIHSFRESHFCNGIEQDICIIDNKIVSNCTSQTNLS